MEPVPRNSPKPRESRFAAVAMLLLFGIPWTALTLTADFQSCRHAIEDTFWPQQQAEAPPDAPPPRSFMVIAMAMLPFNVVMVGLWLGIRYQVAPPAAGGARVFDDGRFVRLRLSGWTPLWAALVAASAAAFVLIFVVVFAFGPNRPLWALLTAWALIAAAGAAMYRRISRGFRKDDPDLLIDTFANTLTLPQAKRRPANVVIPFARIVSIDVEYGQERLSNGDTRDTSVPTITFLDADDTQRRESLVDYWGSLSSEQLVKWLRNRCLLAR